MKNINIVNFGLVSIIGLAFAACQGPDGPHATDDTNDTDAGGAAGSGGSSGNAGSAGSAGTAAGTGGTDGGEQPPKCIPGLVRDCECKNGDDGVQTCKGDGTFGECQHEGSGGSGGTAGSGGSAGSSGSSSGGSGGLPGCIPGEIKDCRCKNLDDGTQTCSSDGTSYGQCMCPDGGSGGSGGDAGHGGTGGEPTGDTVDVTFEFILPSSAPSIKGVTLYGIMYEASTNEYQYADGSAPGKFASWCDSNTATASEKLLQSGRTYTCTVTLPTGKKALVNLLVEGTGGTLFPSNEQAIWACYGVGMNCASDSCLAAYGTLKANGTTLTVPADAEGNSQGGCNLAYDVE